MPPDPEFQLSDEAKAGIERIVVQSVAAAFDRAQVVTDTVSAQCMAQLVLVNRNLSKVLAQATADSNPEPAGREVKS